MKNKKIFFVADARSIHTAKWVDYFVMKGYDIYLATFADKNRTACKKVFFLGDHKTDTSGGNYHYLLGIPKLAKLFKRIRPDIINAHYSYSMGLISVLAKQKAKVESRLSVVCHGSDLLAPPSPYLFDMINRYVLHRCEQVFVVSDQLKDKVSTFNINMEKVFVGQYGIDIQNHCKEKDIDIISNRAYEPNSRIDLLLDTLNTLDGAKLKIIFILPNIQENQYQHLKQSYPDIIFYRHLPHPEMLELVSRSKVYLSATLSDGTSLSLLEAMQLGCIPVLSNIVSNRSWVLDSVNGYLFDNQETLRERLLRAVQSDTDISFLTINQKLIAEKGNYPRQMTKIEKFLMGGE